MKFTETKNSFIADKVSGAPGSCFAFSIVAEAIRWHNMRNILSFPEFYALTLNTENNKADEWINEKLYEKFTDEFVQLVKKKGLTMLTSINNILIKEAESLRQESLVLIPQLSKLGDNELLEAFNQFFQKYIYSFALGAITFPYEGILSERLANSLAPRYPNTSEVIQQSIGANYISFMMKSEQALQNISQNKSNPLLIKKYLKEFFFIKASFEHAPILTELEVQKEIAQLSVHTPAIASKSLTLSLTDEEKLFAGIIKETEIIRDQRKKVNLIGSYMLFRFLEEACARRAASLDIAKNAFWFEYKDLLYNTPKLLKKLAVRKEVSIIASNSNSYYFDYIAVHEPLIDFSSIKQLKGTPAVRGIAKGKARIILNTNEFSTFQKGEILVAEMTRPDFLPLMKKASAIVTDEGGLTSHAAIVARELGVPCIVGTKRATRVLKTGDEVEVNANNGVIRILR